jgi:transposase-like protein
MLQAAIQKEIDEYLQDRSGIVGEDGRRLVIRNGSLPERELITGLGPIQLRQPRVRDKRPVDEREVFHSSILPKYLRKTKSIEELVPWLYLKGISTNDFPEALQSLLGKDAKGFSPTTITRLKSIWEEEYDEWSKRSLKDKRYVYLWADGIHSNIVNGGEKSWRLAGEKCSALAVGKTRWSVAGGSWRGVCSLIRLCTSPA